jgi:hypothetical protein
VGRAEKWRSLFLGVELAVRCERSEHGKSQLSIKAKIFVGKKSCLIIPFCPILQNFQPYFLQVCTVARLRTHYIQRDGRGGGLA